MQLIISDAQGIILVNLGDRLLDEASVEERLKGGMDKSDLKYMISRDAVEGQNLQLMLIHKDEKLGLLESAGILAAVHPDPAGGFCCFMECVQVCKEDHLPAYRSFRTPPDRNEKRRDA